MTENTQGVHSPQDDCSLGRTRMPYTPQLPKVPLGSNLSGRGGLLRLVGRCVNWIHRQRFLRRLPFGHEVLAERRVHRKGGRLLVFEILPGITPHQAAISNRDLVVSLCEKSQIPYFVVPVPSERRARVGVPAEHWPRFAEALRTAGRQKPIYVGVAATRGAQRHRWPELTIDDRIARAVEEQPELEVFTLLAQNHDTRRYFGRPWACVVERWQREEDNALVAPTRNARASALAASGQQPAAMIQWGRRVDTLQALTSRHIFDIDFPIDAVYMWVDGGDAAWRARKAHALGLPLDADALSTDDERFRDNGELRYSLRSLEEYASWFRRVYLVTDKQVPPWLERDHPHLQVVDHTEIFGDHGTLPSFNSHAIGGRLHHIAGLSEHYVHMNDDFFFGREVHPHTFFQGNGVSKFFLSKTTLKVFEGQTEAKHEDARRNVVELLGTEFGRRPSRTFFHTPIPQRRSVLFELERRYAPQFEATWNHQFRHSSDIEINSWLHHYYGYLTGTAIPASISYDYFDLTEAGAWARMRRTARVRSRDVFCVNDTADTSLEQRDRARDWLAAYFPRRSTFENDDS